MSKLIQSFFLFFTVVTMGQENALKVTKIESKKLLAHQFIGWDAFGFYYYNSQDVFYKSNGIQTYSYTNLSLGKITRVDIQNPLKIVLFYKNFNSVILLDNQLNEINRLNFSNNLEPIDATAVGTAAQNVLWVNNAFHQKIGIYDLTKNTFTNLSNVIPNDIQYYQTDFNYFYWIDGKNNWYACTLYGKIYELGKIPPFDAIQLLSDTSYLFKKEGLLYYANKEKVTLLPIDEKNYADFYYKNQILTIFTRTEINNYQINLP